MGNYLEERLFQCTIVIFTVKLLSKEAVSTYTFLESLQCFIFYIKQYILSATIPHTATIYADIKGQVFVVIFMHFDFAHFSAE